jgi:hypothetical protein
MRRPHPYAALRGRAGASLQIRFNQKPHIESGFRYSELFVLAVLQMFLEVLAGITLFYLDDFFGRAFGHNVATAVAAFGAKVNDVVGQFDDVHVVLNDEHGMAIIGKAL